MVFTKVDTDKVSLRTTEDCPGGYGRLPTFASFDKAQNVGSFMDANEVDHNKEVKQHMQRRRA
jgi:hypothetical protein